MLFEAFYFFIIGAFLGWVLEIVYKIITKKQNKSAGILFGPFCILYGIGVMIISLIFNGNISPKLIFLLTTVLMSVLEYITYILLFNIYGIKLWDYSEKRFNFKGIICLDFSVCWGILSLFYIKYIYPYLYDFYINIQSSKFNSLILMIIFLIILDFIISSVKLLINKRQNEKFSV